MTQPKFSNLEVAAPDRDLYPLRDERATEIIQLLKANTRTLSRSITTIQQLISNIKNHTTALIVSICRKHQLILKSEDVQFSIETYNTGNMALAFCVEKETQGINNGLLLEELEYTMKRIFGGVTTLQLGQDLSCPPNVLKLQALLTLA